jgi:hypothetical protein
MFPVTAFLAIIISCMAQNHVFDDGYRVGGNVARNVGKVVLKNTVSGETVTVTGSGSFMFAKSMENGDSYNIVKEQDPVDQSCMVVNTSGIISGADIQNVYAECSTIAKKNKAGTITVSSRYPAFETPAASPSVQINLSVGADVLITLTTSMQTTTDAVSYVRLLVDGKKTSQGRITTGANKAGPVSFVKIISMPAGNHIIQASYCADSALPVTMNVDGGIEGILTATVLSTMPGYQGTVRSSVNGASVTSMVANTEMDIPGLTVYPGIISNGTTVIGLLPLLEMRRDIMDAINIIFYSNSDNIGTGSIISNPGNDFIPMTFFGGQSFAVDTVLSIKANWKSVNPWVTFILEDSSETVISSLKMNTYTTQSGLQPAVISYPPFTTSPNNVTYSEVGSNPINLVSPSRLLIAMVSNNSVNNKAADSSYYALAVDDLATNKVGETYAMHELLNDTMPVSIFTITDMIPAGSRSIKTFIRSGTGGTITATNVKLTVMRLD